MQIAIVLLTLLIWVVHTNIYHRLQPGITLINNDQITSTLGIFKIVLTSIDCSLNLYKFDSSTITYKPTSQKYKGTYSGACEYLKISDNRIISNGSNTFLQLSASNLSKAFLTIDDNGVIRFTGVKNPNGNALPSDFSQIKIENFTQTQTYISILDQFNKISDKFTQVTNKKNWIFSVSNQQLTITNLQLNLVQTFTLPQTYFAPTGIFNQNNQTIPYAIFDGILYSAVCGKTKNTFEGPFVFKIDEYWPIATVYDQQGYKIFEYSLNYNEGSSNPCPKYTFNYQDQCLTICPLPYFHQTDGEKGLCVLNCQKGSTKDLTKRTCICSNRIYAMTPSYTCVNSTSYYFGCYCQKNTYLDRKTQKCVTNCSSKLQLKAGICANCSKNCATCTSVSNGVIYSPCLTCNSGYTLTNGYCIQSLNCPQNCLVCLNSICSSCKPFFALNSNTCVQTCPTGTQLINQNNLTNACVKNSLATLTCPQNCVQCSNSNSSICIVCKPGFVLFISPVFTSCRRKTISFSCNSPYYSLLSNETVCYSNDISSLTTLSNCLNSIHNCLLCSIGSSTICLACISGYKLQQNTCVIKCSSTYHQINQGCIKNINNCVVHSFHSGKFKSSVNLDIALKNQAYLSYVNQGMQPQNEPYGYQLYARNFHLLINDTTSIQSHLEWSKQQCSQCKNGYGLSSDFLACLPCPSGCLLCYIADVSSCITSNKQDVISYTFGTAIGSCNSFLTPNFQCLKSCPGDTLPNFNSDYSKVECVTNSQSTTVDYLKIDGSSFAVNSNQYIHKFIFNQKITPIIKRYLQTTNFSNTSIDADGNSITIMSNRATQILDLSGIIQNFQSVNGLYPVNTVYGINEQTSFKGYLKKWLAYIGYILSIIIVLVHCIYVGNSFLYKMDNLLIFCQTIFFFLFNQIYISNPIAQYYYGWSWSHLNFYPNYFQPQLKYSQPTQTPYALYNLDANIIRNAGSSLSLLLTFALIWFIISIGIYIADTYFGRSDLWYFRISKNTIIAAFQFFSYNIFYWCIAFITYDKGYLTQGTFVGLAVLFLISIIIFTISRIYFNHIAGLYMIKRIVYASVLASSYQKVGYIGFIIFIQISFGIARSLLQKPRKKRDLVFLWIQQGMIILMMIILYTTTNASVVAILITMLVYGWFLLFVSDLVDIYLATKNKVFDMKCFNNLFDTDNSDFRGSEEDNMRDNQDAGHTDRPFQSKVQN